MTISVRQGDCLKVLSSYDDGHFSAACFSPPYGVGKGLFDARYDFGAEGAFLEYALEISRVSEIWAINLTQIVQSGTLLTYTEDLVKELQIFDVQLWDRWMLLKPGGFPKRGPRVPTRYEFVISFTSNPAAAKEQFRYPVDGESTVLSYETTERNPTKSVGTAPYPPSIPRQMWKVYGADGPVLDPFCGTGTSLIEAKKLGLDATGIEMDPAIVKIAKRRLKDA